MFQVFKYDCTCVGGLVSRKIIMATGKQSSLLQVIVEQLIYQNINGKMIYLLW